MNVSDSDLAMLELMLDGELPEEAAETLRASMRHDADLASAWEALQAERAQRLAIWHDDQPTQQRANIVVSRVLHQNRPAVSWLRWSVAARAGGAIAACMVLGFGLGWYGRGAKTVNPSPSPAAMNNVAGTSAGYRVELLGSDGRPVAAQQFPSYGQAEEFANGLNQWRTASMVVPVSSESIPGPD